MDFKDRTVVGTKIMILFSSIALKVVTKLQACHVIPFSTILAFSESNPLLPITKNLVDIFISIDSLLNIKMFGAFDGMREIRKRIVFTYDAPGGGTEGAIQKGSIATAYLKHNK